MSVAKVTKYHGIVLRVFELRAHVSCVSNDTEAQSMERNIGDQLNKAFEAYRQASIEKDSAERELQQKTEYYEKYTQQLQQQIEDQNQLILNLKAQLSLTTKHTSGEGKCFEPILRKQEVETLSASDQDADTPCISQKRKQEKDCMEAAAMSTHMLPGAINMENKDVLVAFRELQGKFNLIQTLTKKQKVHLRNIYAGNNTANEQRFSMPIQCTDVTVEQAEGPFPSSFRAEDLATASLASRGASPEDGDFVDSLTKLSVKFPPSTDSEYEFLNSAPEKFINAVLGNKGSARDPSVLTVAEQLAVRFPHPLPAPTGSPSSPLNLDSIRGPQKPVWSPEFCEASMSAAGADPQQSTSPKNCAFCDDLVPQDDMYSHLNSHFQNKTSNGH
ncbi:hypothetical protein AAFF_G00328640 [Aldrovandia affinis]|uniref:Tbk1/Ikki binding domain-containing protein n=1 Tax=Aldrovandia affinis TaxID=143900 RepID=A0AAD7T9Q7_9TELE|nr:hypothetical protein AAFF_G00328640 [Aldrovandia affinis]